MPGYFDGFGRRGRFGIQTAPAPAMPYMDAPRTAPLLRPMDQGPTLAENPNMPGGYASSLRQAGVSSGYATKLALQRDRAQQGSMNTYTPRERADIYSAPMTGTAMFSPMRQGMEAVNRGINAGANYTEQMTAPMVQGQNYFNQAQNIQNQYAPQGIQADINYQNARTAGLQGGERRAQSEFDLTAPTFRPRAEAETGRIQAQTGQIGAETNAIDRDYRQRIGTYEEQNSGMKSELNRQMAIIRAMQQQINAFQRATGQKETVWPDDSTAAGEGTAEDVASGQGAGQQAPTAKPSLPNGAQDNGDGTISLNGARYKRGVGPNGQPGWVRA